MDYSLFCHKHQIFDTECIPLEEKIRYYHRKHKEEVNPRGLFTEQRNLPEPLLLIKSLINLNTRPKI